MQLSPESIEFLKAIDALDLFVGIPPVIDERLYRAICRHRRLKIENELEVSKNENLVVTREMSLYCH